MAPKENGKPEDLSGKKPWTVMIYMIADDPAGGELLDQQANRELDEIIHATLGGDRKNLNVAVQVDFRNQPDVWRRLVGTGTWVQPESAAADPATLYGFFDWVADACPAYRYVLMLWGHSRGPFGLFTDRFSSLMGSQFAADNPQTYIAQTLTLRELRVALRNARECLKQQVDIIVFKDCFMSTLETAYELKDSATYLVASPDIVPIEGWPYSQMFAPLSTKTEAKDAASAILAALHTHYAKDENRHGLKQVAYSLLDTSALTNVSEPLSAVAQKLAADPTLRKLLSTVPHGDPALADVGLLCRKLKGADVKEAAEALEKAIKDVVLTPADYDLTLDITGSISVQIPGPDKKPAAGVSLFFYPPTKAERQRSLVAALASRNVYSDLAITSTGWQSVALEGMPEETAPTSPYQNGYAPGSEYELRNTLLTSVLDQLQRGILEQIARSVMGFAPKPLGFTPKPLGFAPKPLGFAPKPLGFGPKPLGFAAELRLARQLGIFDPEESVEGGAEHPSKIRHKKTRKTKRVKR